jgi:hypothetical protein
MRPEKLDDEATVDGPRPVGAVYAPRVSRWIVFARVALSAGALGCSRMGVTLDEPKHEPFEVQINVVSDPGVALPGASVLSGTHVVGHTNDAGAAKLKVGGNEGDQVELNVKCPTDFDSPTKPLVVSLKRFAAGSPPPQFEARCPPATRTVVVGVRADNGPNLPVLYMGRAVARTDASGAALFTVKVKPADQVEVTLSTSEAGAEPLRPQSPTLTFVAKDYDDFVVLDENFTVLKKRAPVVHVNRPERLKPEPL